MASIFTKIINGEIPCYKVAENEFCIAFLDINPLAKGHTLVVPKVEFDYIFDVQDLNYTELMLFAKKVGKAIEKIVACKRIGVTVIGLEVPHAHIHLIPINHLSDMNFSKPKLNISGEELKQLASAISREFNV